MSVTIATMGMFNNCCGNRVVGGGGAPPYHPYNEGKSAPVIFVKNVHITNKTNDISLENIKVTLLVGSD